MVGRKALLYIAVTLSLASSVALVCAPDLPVLFVSKLLLGLSIGLSTAIPPLYVTENAPANLRSTASSLTNVIIVLGFFCSSLTGFGASHISGVWSFRTAFVMTFAMPAIYLIGLPFFPESPVWYMKKGREEDARKAALRLFGPTADIDGRIEVMKHELKQTEEEEQRSAFSQTSWRAIFSKEHRTRTLVAVLGLQSQNFSGGYFANTYQTYYFELIGQADPFGLTAISSSLQFLSNLVAVGLSDVIPRRKGLIGGGVLLMFWSVIIAGTSIAPTTNVAAATALLAFMITWSMLYTATVGCYGWAVAQETAAQATRPKTISFVLVCQQLTALMLSSVFPYFINPDQLNCKFILFTRLSRPLLIISLQGAAESCSYSLAPSSSSWHSSGSSNQRRRTAQTPTWKFSMPAGFHRADSKTMLSLMALSWRRIRREDSFPGFTARRYRRSEYPLHCKYNVVAMAS